VFKVFCFVSILILSACGNVGGINLGQYSDAGASPQKFTLCHGYGCSYKTVTNFTDKEWQTVQKVFNKKSKNAEEERQKIAKAISSMEKYMGEAVGTKNDLPLAPIIRRSVKELDCIDETINTTMYLKFLNDDGLMKFHKIGRPIYKGYIFNGVYPHNSASIEEIETGGIYAVDSYIFANGEEPNIRPLDSWLKYSVAELERAENLNGDVLENIKP
jgi:uncharacterized protein YrzB (UPF0473 family)